MHAIQDNEDKLKVIGSLLPSNNVDEGGPLLQVLDMLEDVDILRLSHTCSAMRGILQWYLARYYKGKKPALQLACGIGGDAFESRLEDAVQYALGEIRKVGRDLGWNAPYKQSNPHTYVYVTHKFNVTKQALIRSIDEHCLESDDEWEGSENYGLHVCLCVFFLIGRGARRKKCTALPRSY